MVVKFLSRAAIRNLHKIINWSGH